MLMFSIMKSKYITIEETAKILQVTKPTVYNYIKEGLLAKYRVKKKSVLNRDEVQSLLEPRPVTSNGTLQ